jgi:hypothetical protein
MAETKMTHLEVGQRYPLPFAADGGHYTYSGEHGHDLLLAFSGLTAREVEDVRSGPAEFGLFALPRMVGSRAEGLLFFLYRFGSVGWGDFPYSWHLEASPEKPEPLTGVQRILLSVTLVELPENIVRVLRAISLTPEFSRVLVEQIRAQAEALPIGRDVYDRAIKQLYRTYTVDHMVRSALIRCQGGL